MANLLNPSGNPYIDEAIRRGLLDAGKYMGQAAQDPINLGKGLLSGAVGLSGDVQEMGNMAGNAALGLLSRAPITGPLAASLVNYEGRSAPTTPEVGGLLGADVNSPGFQVGEVGAPDPNDIGRGLLGMTLLHGSPHGEEVFRKGAAFADEINNMTFYRGLGSDDTGRRVGEYFTDDPVTADSYIPLVSRANDKPGQMLEVKFNVKNPYVVDMAGKMKDDALDKKYIRLAEEGGHDAVVFRNFRDSQSAGQRTGGLLEQVRGGSESTVVIPLSDDALPEVVNARTIDKRFSSKPKKTQAETIQRNIDESLQLAKEYKQRGLLDNDPELLAIAEAFENDAKKLRKGLLDARSN